MVGRRVNFWPHERTVQFIQLSIPAALFNHVIVWDIIVASVFNGFNDLQRNSLSAQKWTKRWGENYYRIWSRVFWRDQWAFGRRRGRGAYDMVHMGPSDLFNHLRPAFWWTRSTLPDDLALNNHFWGYDTGVISGALVVIGSDLGPLQVSDGQKAGWHVHFSLLIIPLWT